jgi:hypothetical protein
MMRMKRLKEIDALVMRLFAERWAALHAPGALAREDLRFPGVYLLAYTDARLAGRQAAPGKVFFMSACRTPRAGCVRG